MDVVAVRVRRRAPTAWCAGHGDSVAVRVVGVVLRGDGAGGVALPLLRHVVGGPPIRVGRGTGRAKGGMRFSLRGQPVERVIYVGGAVGLRPTGEGAVAGE